MAFVSTKGRWDLWRWVSITKGQLSLAIRKRHKWMPWRHDDGHGLDSYLSLILYVNSAMPDSINISNAS